MATIMRTGGGGADLSVVTAGASDVLAGKVIVDANGNALNGTIPSKSAQTYTPGTANQTIAAGQYLSGAQTISGDADLIATNIASGKNIFGVAGNFSLIKSYQRGEIVTTGATSAGSVTISSIDRTKAVVRITPVRNAQTAGSAQSTGIFNVRGVLTNNTTLTWYRSIADDTLRIQWEIIEFNGVKSKQSGEILNTNFYTNPATSISAVNQSKSLLFWTGGVTASTYTPAMTPMFGYLSSSTQITWFALANLTQSINWEIIEFY